MTRFLFLVVFVGLLQAQSITWSECVSLASANNNTLRLARERVVAQQESVNGSWSGLWPHLSLGANTQHAENTRENASQPTKSDSVGYNLSLKQSLFDGFKTYNEAQAADKNLQAAEYDLFVTDATVRLSLRSAFINLLKAQEQKSLADVIVARRAQNFALIKLRYDGGREHKGALLLARADLNQAEADVVQAERAIKLAQRKLVSIIGGENLAYTVTENSPVLNLAETPDFAKIASTSPQLRQLEAKLDAAKFSAIAVKGQQFPQIYASYQTGKSGDSWPPEDSSWSLGGSLSFTAFDGNANGASLARAESTIKQADLQILDGRQTVELTLAQSWTELENAQENLTIQQSFLLAAQERSRIAGSQYAVGLISFEDWSRIEDSLVSSEKALVNSRASVLLAEAAWIQACGGGLNAN